jgi:putative ABC transport system substrate-binding protein
VTAKMQRREFITLLGGTAVAWPLAAGAQQPDRVRRMGVLMGLAESDPESNAQIVALRNGLQERGWAEGRNLEIELRYAEGKPERLRTLAIELVQKNVQVIVTHGTPAVQAAQEASATVPIVFATIGDPLGAGVVASLARPGGNITGLSLIATDLSTKRLEVLKETLPHLTRVAMLWNPKNASLALQYKETEAAARQLGLRLHSLPAVTMADFDIGIKAAAETGADAVITTSDANQVSQRARIVELALRNRLPVVGEFREIAAAGALLSYGPNRVDMWRRAAGYVDKIFKGTKPSDLPVEQPTRFELIMNSKTARTLGLTIPPTLLARADEVIE